MDDVLSLHCKALRYTTTCLVHLHNGDPIGQFTMIPSR